MNNNDIINGNVSKIYNSEGLTRFFHLLSLILSFYDADCWMIRQLHFKRKKVSNVLHLEYIYLYMLFKLNGRCNAYWLKHFLCLIFSRNAYKKLIWYSMWKYTLCICTNCCSVLLRCFDFDFFWFYFADYNRTYARE